MHQTGPSHREKKKVKPDSRRKQTENRRQTPNPPKEAKKASKSSSRRKRNRRRTEKDCAPESTQVPSDGKDAVVTSDQDKKLQGGAVGIETAENYIQFVPLCKMNQQNPANAAPPEPEPGQLPPGVMPAEDDYMKVPAQVSAPSPQPQPNVPNPATPALPQPQNYENLDVDVNAAPPPPPPPAPKTKDANSTRKKKKKPAKRHS
uniref:Uncharacterized protein n=1 Tax=Panagrolaimus sp. JU765 TaxID=591449 RepID=A0AC34QB46_9BILA